MNNFRFIFVFVWFLYTPFSGYADSNSVRDAVVHIHSHTSSGQVNIGSGFIVTTEGMIATNYHVIKDAERIVVYDFDGRELDFQLVLIIDAKNDIAIIRVAPSSRSTFRPLPLESNFEVFSRRDLRVTCIGHPNNNRFFVSSGYVLDRSFRRAAKSFISSKGPIFPISMDNELIPLQMPARPGMSGAPIIKEGYIIGMLTGAFSASQDEPYSWAVPINHVQDAIAKARLENGMPLQTFRSWPDLELVPRDGFNRSLLYRSGYSAQYEVLLDRFSMSIENIRTSYRSLTSVSLSVNERIDDTIMLTRSLLATSDGLELSNVEDIFSKIDSLIPTLIPIRSSVKDNSEGHESISSIAPLIRQAMLDRVQAGLTDRQERKTRAALRAVSRDVDNATHLYTSIIRDFEQGLLLLAEARSHTAHLDERLRGQLSQEEKNAIIQEELHETVQIAHLGLTTIRGATIAATSTEFLTQQEIQVYQMQMIEQAASVIIYR